MYEEAQAYKCNSKYSNSQINFMH